MAPTNISNLIDAAIATSSGMSDMVDPIAWSIVDDKLYLNLSLNIRRKWSKDFPGNIPCADANWPAVPIKSTPESGEYPSGQF